MHRLESLKNRNKKAGHQSAQKRLSERNRETEGVEQMPAGSGFSRPSCRPNTTEMPVNLNATEGCARRCAQCLRSRVHTRKRVLVTSEVTGRPRSQALHPSPPHPHLVRSGANTDRGPLSEAGCWELGGGAAAAPRMYHTGVCGPPCPESTQVRSH